MKKIILILAKFVFILTLILFVAGCVGNKALETYLAASNNAFLSNLKVQAYNKYSKEISHNREVFEASIDRFYVNTILIAEKEEVLTASGIVDLNKKEMELRKEMDDVEYQSLKKLDIYLASFDAQINKNNVYLKSVIDQEKLFATEVIKLSESLNTLSAEMVRQASVRREQKLFEAKAKYEKAIRSAPDVPEEEFPTEEPVIPEPIETPDVVVTPTPVQ